MQHATGHVPMHRRAHSGGQAILGRGGGGDGNGSVSGANGGCSGGGKNEGGGGEYKNAFVIAGAQHFTGQSGSHFV